MRIPTIIYTLEAKQYKYIVQKKMESITNFLTWLQSIYFRLFRSETGGGGGGSQYKPN